MKLIYISHWRFPSEKTMSPLVMKTCEMFAKNGFIVELWVPWRNNRKFSQDDAFIYHHIDKNFIFRKIPALDLTGFLPGNIFFLLMIVTFNFFSFIYLLFQNRKDTILYFHDERDLLFSVFLKTPKFLEIHDFYKSSFNLLNIYVFRRISGFVVTNKIKMASLLKDYRIRSEAMIHRPNGVDVALFDIKLSRDDARKLLNLPMSPKIVLYTGHLFDWKGVDTLFDSHRFLSENEIIYFVGGTDEDIEKFRKKTQEAKSTNIEVVGRRPHAEIPMWYKAADALVLPNTAKIEASRIETSPVKLFEYLSSGTPIIASDLPSIRNIVDESMVTFFTPDDPISLANSIKKVFQNDAEFRLKSEIALKEAKKYSWEERTRAIMQLIDSVVH